MTPERFAERIEGRPSPPRGMVFEREFRAAVHFQRLEYVPGHVVHVSADPGYSRITESAYAVECWQVIEGQVRVFHEVYQQEMLGPQVIEQVMRAPWWAAAEKRGSIDVAGKQHQMMPSQVEVWLAKSGLYMHPQSVGILEGIERLRMLLRVDPVSGRPGLVMDLPRVEVQGGVERKVGCWGLGSELGGCANPFTGDAHVYAWAKGQDGAVLGDVPRDRYNHGVKALTYGIVAEYGHARELPETAGLSRNAVVTRW